MGTTETCITTATKLLRYMQRMFKSGVLAAGELTVGQEGVPQGSLCSPVLANIFAHNVIDVWLEDVVKPHCPGKVAWFRYADDMVCCEYSVMPCECVKRSGVDWPGTNLL